MTFAAEIEPAFACDDCGKYVPISVCRSAAGYYIGQWCCGPICRLSTYYTEEDATEKLKDDTWERRMANDG